MPTTVLRGSCVSALAMYAAEIQDDFRLQVPRRIMRRSTLYGQR
jgi:hypothetical protein